MSDQTPPTVDLDAIRARAKAATPGPWEALSGCVGATFESTQTAGLGFDVEGPPHPELDRYRFESGADAVFVAAARTDVPALCRTVEVLRAERDELRELLHGARLLCPVHGPAACPEEYMLHSDGSVGLQYIAHWDESLRCGRRPKVDVNDGKATEGES